MYRPPDAKRGPVDTDPRSNTADATSTDIDSTARSSHGSLTDGELDDLDRLRRHEEVIERGLTTFIDVGLALIAIKAQKLYVIAGYSTFDTYCEERWLIKHARRAQLMMAATIAEEIVADSTMVELPAPTSERQVRPLVNVPRDERPKVWRRAVEAADGGEPTGEQAEHAVAATVAGWEVFPISRTKVPMEKAPPDGKGGFYTASADPEKARERWTRYPSANIGMRPPAWLVVVDIDPRKGGDVAWSAFEQRHSPVATLTVWSGRGDGGRHLYFQHPGGHLKSNLNDVCEGIDIKGHNGLVVFPPSIHAATGLPYRWDDPAAPVARMPAWLANLCRRPAPVAPGPRRLRTSFAGSPADWFTKTHSWRHVLEPHGWHVVDGSGDGDSDGSRWLHPQATSDASATVKHGCLFVYSTSTTFEVTEAGDVHGYTRFRAWAVLNHRGDLSAAARAAQGLRDRIHGGAAA